MRKILLITSFVVTFSTSIFGEEAERSHVPRLTHNLSGTTYMMAARECTIGAQIIGCGLNGRAFLATSAWMYGEYNMYVVSSRITLIEYENHDRFSVQASYFKTFQKHTDVQTYGGVTHYH